MIPGPSGSHLPAANITLEVAVQSAVTRLSAQSGLKQKKPDTLPVQNASPNAPAGTVSRSGAYFMMFRRNRRMIFS
jgi:hypothetical protein